MTNEKILIDTDVLIDYLRGNPPAVHFLEDSLNNFVCYISSMSIAELYVGVREGNEQKILDQFINEFQVIVLSTKIAQIGGLYRRNYGKSHGIGLADAIIAATVTDLDGRLITLNKKHYPMIHNILVPYHKK